MRGPNHGNFKNLTGKTYGRLTVLTFAGWEEGAIRRRSLWLCRCSGCGKERAYRASQLSRYGQLPCRCKGRLLTGHRQGHELYETWRGMWKRCTNERYAKYPSYGGRGIKVHSDWRDFGEFLADVGPRPTRRHSLDRINVDGDYAPGNVRWATDSEQSRNRRRLGRGKLKAALEEILQVQDIESVRAIALTALREGHFQPSLYA